MVAATMPGDKDNLLLWGVTVPTFKSICFRGFYNRVSDWGWTLVHGKVADINVVSTGQSRSPVYFESEILCLFVFVCIMFEATVK